MDEINYEFVFSLTNIETGIFERIWHGEYPRANVALEQVDQGVHVRGGVLQVAMH